MNNFTVLIFSNNKNVLLKILGYFHTFIRKNFSPCKPEQTANKSKEWFLTQIRLIKPQLIFPNQNRNELVHTQEMVFQAED